MDKEERIYRAERFWETKEERQRTALERIIDIYADELGWIDDNTFCAWMSWDMADEFLETIRDIYGPGLFDDGGITAHVGDRYICFELSDTYIDIEEIYPKEEYRH